MSDQLESQMALDVGFGRELDEMTRNDIEGIEKLGRDFAKKVDGPCIFISGKLVSDNQERGTEGKIRDMLHDAFGYPKADPDSALRINLLLDSRGGSLDAAYLTALYLNAYTKNLRVYVPRRAKSASTLLALGARELFISTFGELGPLDTQMHDPRNPRKSSSALDCYQSVDYVRTFATTTIVEVLRSLIAHSEEDMPIKEIALGDLLDKSSVFATGAIQPMLERISALDFGGWGRSLLIGQRYAERLLKVNADVVDKELIESIARKLVFNYTHHPFPIDYKEARSLGLPVHLMDRQIYEKANSVVTECDGRDFIGFLSGKQAKRHKKAEKERQDAQKRKKERERSSHPMACQEKSEYK